MGLRTYFNNRAEKKRERKAFEASARALENAIENRENQLVPQLFAALKTSPLYHSGTTARLLRAAINADNEPAFTLVLNTLDNPNVLFDRFSAGSSRGPITTGGEHILHAALAAGSHDIALSLAKNEKVSVLGSGSLTVYYGLGGGKTVVPYEAPLTLAREKGMTDVARELTKRQAVSYYASLKAGKRKSTQKKPAL